MKKKISKKIVALLTMAAFVLTLLPVAAFAETDTNATYSGYTLESTAGGELVVNLDLNKNESFEASTGFDSTLVKVSVSGADTNTSVTFDGVVKDVKTLADNGVAVTKADTVIAFSGLPAGDQTVTVQLTTDNSSWTTLHGYKVGDAANVNDTNHAAPVITVTGEVYTQATGSRLLIDNTTGPIDVTAGDTETVEFQLVDAGGKPAKLASDEALYVWAVSNGTIVDTISVAGATAEPMSGVYQVPDTKDGDTVAVTFNVDGTYVLYAGVGPEDTTNIGMSDIHEISPITVNVAAKTFETSYIKVNTVEGEAVNGPTMSNNDKVSNWTYTIEDNVTPNGLKTYTVKGVAYTDLNGTTPAENETLTLTCQNAGLTLDKETVTTNAKGEFEFTFSLSKTGDFEITISELSDQVAAVLTITQNSMAPVSISTAKDDGLLLAGTDKNWIYNDYKLMSSAVQFNIKDAYNRDATGDSVLNLVCAASENGNDYGFPNRNDFIDVVAPTGSSLTDSDIALAWDDTMGVYTLKYIGNDPAKDLIPGEYKVTVSLNNGVDATATFTLAEFQGAKSLSIGLYAQNRHGGEMTASDNAIVAIDDQVALGQKVTGTIYLVDAQGLAIKAPASNLSVGINGNAATNKVVSNPLSFDTLWNVPANASLLGSTITIQAYDDVNKLYVEKELTVVENYLDETLAFDPVQGPVDTTNTVNVTVVDADNNVSKVNGEMTAYIASQSNEEATITLTMNEKVKNGQGKLYLTSDAEGTVDVVVAVKGDNGEIYAKTLTYTFGDEDPLAGTTVVMTIGSADFVINNKVVTMTDAAPYVESSRTFVPFRALGEALGADVEWKDDARTVTYTLGDNTVVMTPGETTYTVNGESKTMDVAPVITGDRTYVPVRFVGEALGFNVTALYDTADGTTESVVFQK